MGALLCVSEQTGFRQWLVRLLDQKSLTAPARIMSERSRRTLLGWLAAGALLDPANRPMVILIHGALAVMEFWKPLLSALTEYCSVASYTLYGHHSLHDGRSLARHPLRGGSYALERHAQDLLALIDKVGAGPAHLVGHDLGSNIALRAAMIRPEKVATWHR